MFFLLLFSYYWFGFTFSPSVSQGVTVRSSPNVPLRVGENATLTCTNDASLAYLLEWRSVDGTVLARATLVNMLELLLAPVNDSLSVQGTVFTCHVTRNSTMFTQNAFIDPPSSPFPHFP